MESQSMKARADAYERPCVLSLKVLAKCVRACGSGFVPVREIARSRLRASSRSGQSVKGLELKRLVRMMRIVIMQR